MAVFNSSVLTARGNELLVDAVAGDKIIFTRMVVGCGEYLEEEKEHRVLEKATSLKDVRQEFTFSTHKKVSEQCVLLTAVISNKGLDYSYKITEIGVYGKRDGEEEDYLCSIAVTRSLEESDTFPPYNGLQECQIVQDYYITISPDAEVSVNMQGACVLREEFDEIKVILEKLKSGAFADVANSLLITEEGCVLDARQGKVLKDTIDTMKTSFQAGVDTLYNKCVSCGATPTAKTPAAISIAIGKIYTDRYNAGRIQGQNDVKNNPGDYGISGIIAAQTSGDATTLDVSNIAGYQNFTEDNFVFQITAKDGDSNGWASYLGHHDNYDTSLGGGYEVEKSYNQNTGVFTGAVYSLAGMKNNQADNISWEEVKDYLQRFRVPAKIALIT